MTLHSNYRNHEIHQNYPLFPDNYSSKPKFYILNPHFPKDNQLVGFARSLPDAKNSINNLEDLWYPCITPWMNEWFHLNEKPDPLHNLIIKVYVKNDFRRTGRITNVWNNMNEFILWYREEEPCHNLVNNYLAIALLENGEWGVVDFKYIPRFWMDTDPIEYWNPFTEEFTSLPQNE